MQTKHIGLLATATTTYEEPFLLARKFASLDHLSKGRACWNIVTTSNAEDSLNFGKDEHLARDDRYERAREFVEVCKGLWDSWAEDAFLQDKATGQYLDLSQGPRAQPQGQALQGQGPAERRALPAGLSGDVLGRPVGARHASSPPSPRTACSARRATKQQALAFYNDMKGRMAKYGRAPDTLRVLPGAVVYVGRTAAEAEEDFEELQALITSRGRRAATCRSYVDMDLSKYPIDGPLPDLSAETAGGIAAAATPSRRWPSARSSRSGRPTSGCCPSIRAHRHEGRRQAGGRQDRGLVHEQGLRRLQHPCRRPAAGPADFVDLVVPELQRRGLFRKEYTGKTMRENMGLPTPVNPYFSGAAVAAE